jgi:hypothetical protein
MDTLLLEDSRHTSSTDHYHNERWLGFKFFEGEQSFNARIQQLSQECLVRQARLHQLFKAAVIETHIAKCNQYSSPLHRDHALSTHQRYVDALYAEIQAQEALANVLSDCKYRNKSLDILEEQLEDQLDEIFEVLIKTRIASSNLFSLNKRNAHLGGNVWGLEVDMLPQEVFEHHLLILGGGRRQARRATKPAHARRSRVKNPAIRQNAINASATKAQPRKQGHAEPKPKKKSKTKPELA